jgi:hypothetical protein
MVRLTSFFIAGTVTGTVESVEDGAAVTDEHVWRVPEARLRPFVSWCTGYRQAVLDPEGNRWYFGTYRGHPR